MHTPLKRRFECSECFGHSLASAWALGRAPLCSRIVAKLILIAEDDDDDAWAIGQTLKCMGITNSIKRAHDGADVITYFKADGPFANRNKFPIPSVLLLDLKMRRIGGLAVMEWLNGKKEFLPGTLVVALSAYYNKENVQRACLLGARSFLTKPCAPRDIRSLVRAYPSYWETDTPGEFRATGSKKSEWGGANARASV